jgi:ABC-type glycerol-3-phosphate transport system permease component
MNFRKTSISPGKLFATLLKLIPLVGFSIVAAYPVYYMVVTSFKTRIDWLNNQFGLPSKISFDNFVTAATQGRLLIWFRNSVIVTVLSIVISTLFAALAAFAVARMRFRGRQLYLNMMISLMVIPPAVLIVPLFGLMVKGNLINTFQGLIFIYVGLLLPFSIYLLVSFFRGLPVELFDAAAIDGCSSFGTLMRIVIPLSAPALVTLVVVNTLWVWNELLLALIFLQSDELKTLMPGISLFKGRFNNNEPLVLTGAFLASLPMILLYLAGQRFFVQGMVAGAVK